MIALGISFLITATAGAQSNGPVQLRATLKPELHGAGATNHSVAGEMVRNGDFQAAPPQPGTTGDVPGWSSVAEGGSVVELRREAGDDGNRRWLRLTVTNYTGRAGAVNNGSGGMKFADGAWYDLTFSARTSNNKHFGLVVSLENEDGRKVCARATIPEVGGNLKTYTLALHARQSDANGRLVIALPESGTVWFGAVSLVRRHGAGVAGD